MARKNSINRLLDIMARLRAPDGCPWDREQDHQSLRFHAVEEVYELIDAIEARDDDEMVEELGDLLLQVVFHSQLGRERKAFDFELIAERISDKLIRRHPHVFGDAKVKDVDGVWTQWEQIKRAEKKGTKHERPSILDGIPRHLPALLRAEKLVKKARKGGLLPKKEAGPRPNQAKIGKQLLALVREAQSAGLSCENLLRAEVKKFERELRRQEKSQAAKP